MRACQADLRALDSFDPHMLGTKSAPIQMVVRVDTNMHRQPAKSPQNLTPASPSGKHDFGLDEPMHVRAFHLARSVMRLLIS